MERWVPRLKRGLNLEKLDLQPEEAFFLSRIDGNNSAAQISRLCGLTPQGALSILASLSALDVFTGVPARLEAPMREAAEAEARAQNPEPSQVMSAAHRRPDTHSVPAPIQLADDDDEPAGVQPAAPASFGGFSPSMATEDFEDPHDRPTRVMGSERNDRATAPAPQPDDLDLAAAIADDEAHWDQQVSGEAPATTETPAPAAVELPEKLSTKNPPRTVTPQGLHRQSGWDRGESAGGGDLPALPDGGWREDAGRSPDAASFGIGDATITDNPPPAFVEQMDQLDDEDLAEALAMRDADLQRQVSDAAAPTLHDSFEQAPETVPQGSMPTPDDDKS